MLNMVNSLVLGFRGFVLFIFRRVHAVRCNAGYIEACPAFEVPGWTATMLHRSDLNAGHFPLIRDLTPHGEHFQLANQVYSAKKERKKKKKQPQCLTCFYELCARVTFHCQTLSINGRK